MIKGYLPLGCGTHNERRGTATHDERGNPWTEYYHRPGTPKVEVIFHCGSAWWVVINRPNRGFSPYCRASDREEAYKIAEVCG